MTEDLNTPMLHMRLPSRGSKILRRVTMKKILYKALTLDNKWARGLVTKFYDENVCEIADIYGYLYFCRTESICEYIGVEDKNGDEIFVGDIIEDCTTKKRYLICYRALQYYIYNGNSYVPVSIDFLKHCIVVGNEKTKLLKGKR